MLVNGKNEMRAGVQQVVEQQMQTTMVRPHDHNSFCVQHKLAGPC